MITVIINGVNGRVGQIIAKNFLSDSAITCAGGCDIRAEPVPDLEIPVARRIEDIINTGEVVIDFSLPGGTTGILPVCTYNKKPVIIGTTGFSEAELKAISEASKIIPVILSSNFSIGANLLFRMTGLAAKTLDDSYDAEIVEAHHKFKKDAPSGTALTAGGEISKARQVDKQSVFRYGRGRKEERQRGEITFHSVRGGNILSEHSVLFYGEHEIIEISHRAYSRDVFMEGLRKAVLFILNRTPGLYDMMDVLELRK